MKIEKEKMKKYIKVILLSIIYAIIAMCLLYNVIFSINTTISGNDYFKLFGITLFKMNSELMQDDINLGDLVVVKDVDENQLQEGDIIAYTVNGKTRINKITNKQNEYITKSNKNYNPDIEKILYNQVIGKMVICMPFWGFVIGILQSKITSAVVLIFLVLYFLYNRFIYTKKKERARKKKKFEKGTGSFFTVSFKGKVGLSKI